MCPRSMNIRKPQRRAVLSWLFVGTLFALCGVLAILQYQWFGEVSVAARERLHGTLQATLLRLSEGLNAELTTACSGLVPPNGPRDPQTIETELTSRFDQWKKTTRSGQVLRRVALVIPRKHGLQLLQLDPERGALEESPWPAEWSDIKKRMEARQAPDQFDGRIRPGPPPEAGFTASGVGFTTEIPIFPQPSPHTGPGPFGREAPTWLIVDFNPVYLRDVLLPEIVQRYLGSSGNLDYQVEIVAKDALKTAIYRSDPQQAPMGATADASASLFDPQQFLWPAGPSGRGPRPGRGPAPSFGRWQIFARHRAGSLEAVVASARWRNLGVAGGVLLLIVATAAALIRYTRRTQQLAELQMDFVAGVSHELRTPLTVIHTAAYNLQGKMAHDPGQVERYGALIQREGVRLNNMVEQILQFATAEAGRVIQEREPLSMESVNEEAVAASGPMVEGSQCVVEKTVAAGLPLVLGDRVALRHALENLLTNAAKYGLKGGNWIGIFASKGSNRARDSVEIRVADRGPGIPRDEQARIFDPFFRGARAMEDQIRGTGLGLSLVKKIVEAHGGTIRVESEPGKGTAFILQLPGAPAGAGAPV